MKQFETRFSQVDALPMDALDLLLTFIILYGIMPIRIIPVGLMERNNETKSIFFR